MGHPLYALLSFLEEQRLSFRIDRHRRDSIMISVTVPGERLKTDVFEDGTWSSPVFAVTRASKVTPENSPL